MSKFADAVASFIKSLNGEKATEKGKGEDDPGSPDPGSPDPGAEGSGAGNEADDKDKDEAMEKSQITDATGVLKALASDLQAINKSLEALEKRQDGIEKAQSDVGEAVVGVAELVTKIANAPMPTKAVMVKGLGGEPASSGPSVLTKAEFDQAQRALVKAKKEGRIDLFEASKIESSMQKAMQVPGYKMSIEHLAFIAKELKTA